MSALTKEMNVAEDIDARVLLSRWLLDNPGALGAAIGRLASRNAPKRPTHDLLLIDIAPARMGESGRFRVMRPRPELSALILNAVDADELSKQDDCEAKPVQTMNASELFDRILELRGTAPSPGQLQAMNDASRGRHACFAGWKLDLTRHELASDTAGCIHLPETEFALLLVFLDHPRQVLSREQLVEDTRSTKGHVSVRTLDVYVSRLRRKLRSDVGSGELIATRRSAGYVFNADPRFE